MGVGLFGDHGVGSSDHTGVPYFYCNSLLVSFVFPFVLCLS